MRLKHLHAACMLPACLWDSTHRRHTVRTWLTSWNRAIHTCLHIHTHRRHQALQKRAEYEGTAGIAWLQENTVVQDVCGFVLQPRLCGRLWLLPLGDGRPDLQKSGPNCRQQAAGIAESPWQTLKSPKTVTHQVVATTLNLLQSMPGVREPVMQWLSML